MNVCQPGSRLKCAGYVLYSTATVFVLTIGSGVYGFTLDPLVGEFVLTMPDIKIPEVRRGAGPGARRGAGHAEGQRLDGGRVHALAPAVVGLGGSDRIFGSRGVGVSGLRR